MYKKCIICNEDFLLKSWNQICCNNKQCKKQNDKNKFINRLKNPIYKKEFDDKRKQQALRDYEKHKQRYIENAQKLRYKLKCKECWKLFLWYNSKLVYCSKKCQRVELRKRIWIENPAYRNGFYSTKNPTTIMRYNQKEFLKTCKQKDNILIQKKGYLYCEECKVTNPLRFEHHHLVYRSEKPKHKHLHDIRNIYLLCIKCHNEFHKHKSKRNNIVKERKLNLLFWDDILDK